MYTNWPVFPYNLFLHLLDNVEAVIFEATAPLPDDLQPPAVPCPYLLPPSVKELRLSKVTLDGSSIEGMLSPAGRLEQLYIENIDGGHLGIPSVPFDHDYTTFRESVTIQHFGPNVRVGTCKLRVHLALALGIFLRCVKEERDAIFADQERIQRERYAHHKVSNVLVNAPPLTRIHFRKGFQAARQADPVLSNSTYVFLPRLVPMIAATTTTVSESS
ncbi:uncharacterized protein ARMOST_20312 [Armillaria ostoyae]|uniref:Uncharacterized protein n=1 Tax=Armillaria ostoyae TaxID=47428 RepID=A0A284S6Z9_ARMOS|nr:uncharacterized protein ARMOST_20312 [Armillaria ostoyae]